MKFAMAAAIAWTLAAPGCLAANATNPYRNIDPRNDAGNDTGDAQVEALNQAQIDDGPQRMLRRARAPNPRYAPRAYNVDPRAFTPPEPEAEPGAYDRDRRYTPGEAYASPPGYAAYPPAGFRQAPYGPAGYAPPGYGAPRGYYPPPGYGPSAGYGPPPGY